MKKIVLLLITFLYSFAFNNDFLEPEEAFKPTITQTPNSIVFEMQLGHDIYVYHDKLKVFITQPQNIDMTSKALLPTAEQHEEYMVSFGNPTIKIEILLKDIQDAIKTNNFEIEFFFQGCSKAGLCYAPMSEKLTVGIVQEQNNTVNAQNETDVITNTLKDKSVVIVLLTFFGFGLLLSLTPCVLSLIHI